MQVPSGLFVFLLDIDFVPTPDMHRDLVVGPHRDTLLRMRAAFKETGRRIALVTPAFERLPQRDAAGEVVRDAAGAPQPQPWPLPCRPEHGCEELRPGLAMPRTFNMLRDMFQHGRVLDLFHRTYVRALPSPLPPRLPRATVRCAAVILPCNEGS